MIEERMRSARDDGVPDVVQVTWLLVEFPWIRSSPPSPATPSPVKPNSSLGVQAVTSYW